MTASPPPAPRSTWGFRVLAIGAGLLAFGVAISLVAVIVRTSAGDVKAVLDSSDRGSYADVQSLMAARGDKLRLAMRLVEIAQMFGGIGSAVALVGCGGLVGGRPRWIVALVGAGIGLLVRIALYVLPLVDVSTGRWPPLVLGTLFYVVFGVGVALPRELGKLGRVAGIMLGASSIVFTVGRMIATRSAILGPIAAAIALLVFVALAIAAARTRGDDA